MPLDLSAPIFKNKIFGILLVGASCGALAYVYSTILEYFLEITWHLIPKHVIAPMLPGWPEADAKTIPSIPFTSRLLAGLYMVAIPTLYGLVVGSSQSKLGPPGDMPETVESFNAVGHVDYTKGVSMFVVSLFSVTAGGSLGPEAPLLTLCGSLTGWLYKTQIKITDMLQLRIFSLMGMASGLSAFFGASLGGSLFALEVPHRMGLQYFEAVPYALSAGMCCLVIFRAMQNAFFGMLWPFSPDVHKHIDVRHVLLGIALGALGAGLATVWAKFTKLTKGFLKSKFGLDEHKTPIPCGVIGGFIIGIVGALLPPTMFWGEFELMSFAKHSLKLPHVWPEFGIWQPPEDPTATFLGTYNVPWMFILLGITKFFAITVTLCAGFRGGFIFPLMTAGASIGTAIHLFLNGPGGMLAGQLEEFPVVIWAMCVASGVNTAVTRTPLATPMILAVLSGQGNCAAPCVAAALTALFLTQEVVVIKTQADRKDITVFETMPTEEPEDVPDTEQPLLSPSANAA